MTTQKSPKSVVCKIRGKPIPLYYSTDGCQYKVAPIRTTTHPSGNGAQYPINFRGEKRR